MGASVGLVCGIFLSCIALSSACKISKESPPAAIFIALIAGACLLGTFGSLLGVDWQSVQTLLASVSVAALILLVVVIAPPKWWGYKAVAYGVVGALTLMLVRPLIGPSHFFGP